MRGFSIWVVSAKGDAKKVSTAEKPERFKLIRPSKDALYFSETNGAALTVDVVDVVNSDLLVINFLPPQRELISNAVCKGQRFGDPETI